MCNEENNALFGAIAECLPAFAVVVRVPQGDVVFCNAMARQVFDGTDATTYAEFFHNRELSQKVSEQADAFEAYVKGRWYHVTNTALVSAQAGLRLLTGFDITDIRPDDSCVPISITTDSMTGAANRQSGLNCLDYYLNEAREAGLVFTVCCINLNELYSVGGQSDDDYINTVVSCIRSSTRRSDVLARMATDTFMLVFPNCKLEVVENILGIVSNKLKFINESESKNYSVVYGTVEVNSTTNLDRDYILSTAESKMNYMKTELLHSKRPVE